MIDYNTKAKENLAGVDTLTGKQACNVCGKLYKNRGTLLNHVAASHRGEIMREAAKIEELHILSEITYYHKALFTEFPRKIKKLESAIEVAKAKFAEDPAYYFGWILDDLMVNVFTVKWMQKIQLDIEAGTSLEEIKDQLIAVKETLTKKVLRAATASQSSSRLSNVSDALEAKAIAEFISGYSMSSLDERIRLVNRTIRNAEKLEGESRKEN
jgi:hypothetical protein